ncbi:MAG: redox-sensing transcriptional repressor Rex [Verrucomicrobiota bacterium]
MTSLTRPPAIPRKSIYRLSLYSRCLQRLSKNDVQTVSSETLAKAAGVKPAQLRKDLTHLGNIGRRGLGYTVKELEARINDVMGTNRLMPVVLVGAGNLGTALLSYHGFAKEGFEIVAAFDSDPERLHPVHQAREEIRILSMEALPKFVRKHRVKMAILAVPGAVAQAVANQLVACGIQGILNFSPLLLQLPDHVMANNVNLAIELENLAYFVRS